jgi:formylglycine-generating enzyme required for sulfatase activity
LEEANASNRNGVNDWYIERLPAESPKHRVRLTKAFYLAMTEVTQQQYERVMSQNPSRFKHDTRSPVEMINWSQAWAFCLRLGQLPEEQAIRAIYRLPTEAEWEYSCRAGTTTQCATADGKTFDKYAWDQNNSPKTTHPAGQKLPNAWSLHDMHGNVWELCADWFDESYYELSPLDDPRGPANGLGPVIRGGGWGYGQSRARSAFRSWVPIDRRNDWLGFRVVRSVSASI